MSYTKHTWQTGETIIAENLNHAEDGIEENDITAATNTNKISGLLTFFQFAFAQESTNYESFHEYSAGDYLIVLSDEDKYFCEVISDIAINDIIEMDTNVRLASITDIFNALNLLVAMFDADPYAKFLLLDILGYPVQDGTYVLKCVVEDGEPAINWEEEQ